MPSARVDFVGVNVNDEAPQTVAGFRAEFGLTYPFAKDAQNQTAMAMGVQGLPWVVLLDKAGMVRWTGSRLPAAWQVRWVM